MSLPQSRSGLIARNSVLNFGGQIIPLIVGVASIPFVVRGLGVDRFGILSLAWMLLGYFTLFDLGLGRATTKFIAEELREGGSALPSLFWTSSLMNLLLGVVGGVVVASMAPFLAERVFRIPLDLTNQAEAAFFVLAVSCPVILLSTAFRGALEAAQRFDYVNTIAVIFSSLTFLLPVIGILFGLDIRGIVLLLMISKTISALGYLILCFRVFPILREGVSFDFERLRRLLAYGGWVSISNIVSPLLAYLDRFLIGSLISVAALAYYAAPLEMVTRLSVLPTSLAMALFPSFSTASVGVHSSILNLYSRSAKFLIVLMGPLVALLIFFAGEILNLWLGPDFARTSTVVFQLLAVGVLMNALAQVPFALIQGLGHPDITAKFHLLELAIYVPLVWFLVSNMGIIGGALAWTIRVTIDSGLLFVASGKFIKVQEFLGNGLKRSLGLVALMMIVLLAAFFFDMNSISKVALATPVIILFTFFSWRFVLDVVERELIVSTVRNLSRLQG